MKEERNNALGILFFIFIIVIIIVGSTYLIKQKTTQNNNTNNEVKEEETINLKINTNEDYIYYTTSTTINNLTYKYPVINLNSPDATLITNNLKEYVDTLKNTPNTEEVLYPEFSIYKYDNYVSLVSTEFIYQEELSTINNLKSYTFDITNGNLITEDNLLALFNTNLNNATKTLKNHLNELSLNSIDIDSTLNNLEYTIYIDQDGNLIMMYIVKTTTFDYNDVIELN